MNQDVKYVFYFILLSEFDIMCGSSLIHHYSHVIHIFHRFSDRWTQVRLFQGSGKAFQIQDWQTGSYPWMG